MARCSVPPYPARPHKSGQARIRLKHKELWLGRWGSPESRVKYARIVAEYVAAGSTVVATTKPRAVSVAELLDAFRIFAEARYVKHGRQTSEVYLYRMAVGPLVDLYADLPADKFGPLALEVCRDQLAKKYCRTKVNEHLGRIKRIWKWGVRKQLVSAATWQALLSVPGLRKGEGIERPKITTVTQSSIDAVKTKVLPTVWAMIQLQLVSGCRPGEVCSMRTCDIHEDDPTVPQELRGKAWVYRPAVHKTEHHDKPRLIFLGPKAQEVLRAWLRPTEPEAFLFSPREAVAYRHRQRAAQAKTKRYTPYQRKAKPQRVPGERYTPSAYAHAVAAACKKAGVPGWFPNQLRHNAATVIRQQFGVEVARVILGHSALNTTEIYAEIDLPKAVGAMVSIG